MSTLSEFITLADYHITNNNHNHLPSSSSSPSQSLFATMSSITSRFQLLQDQQQSLAMTMTAPMTSTTSMSFFTDNSCKSNCSGHGDCFNGTCFCEVSFVFIIIS